MKMKLLFVILHQPHTLFLLRNIPSPFIEQATKTCGNWDSAIWKTGLKPSFTWLAGVQINSSDVMFSKTQKGEVAKVLNLGISTGAYLGQ